GLATGAPHDWQWATLLSLFSCVIGLLGLGWERPVARTRVLAFLRHSAIYGLVLAFVLSSTVGYTQNSCSTVGAQKTVVILATIAGITPPSTLTPQSVSDMFFATTPPSVNSYWQEASYGAASATGDVFGWYTLTGTYSTTGCQSLTALQSDAMTA